MKSIVISLVAAVVLAIVGAAFWLTGVADRRVTDVHLELATLQYSSAGIDGDEVAQSLGLEQHVPIMGARSAAELRDVTAMAKYWQSDYPSIAPEKDESGVVTEKDPAILLLEANAAFRASQTETDRGEAIRGLDLAIKNYADLLKTNGQQPDIAFNYEYALRLRTTLAKARPTAPLKPPVRAEANRESDLPAGTTLHGRPGGPPEKGDMSQFRIVIPKSGDERRENPDADHGGAKVKKG